MKFNVLTPSYFADGMVKGYLGNMMPAFGVTFKVVGGVSAETVADALKAAKRICAAPILEPML